LKQLLNATGFQPGNRVQPGLKQRKPPSGRLLHALYPICPETQTENTATFKKYFSPTGFTSGYKAAKPNAQPQGRAKKGKELYEIDTR
jgi:hypothetical protein